ncbi:beta-1 adrenergic receptor [Nematostella vectensis]|uniref:beta-1 adrenergic receptor n=1 Tax=Nematostella vectensis TaxID=45351 RepID=UPI002077858A|nr:beta-1 adrenergic receptor [Nematostella vectensis]
MDGHNAASNVTLTNHSQRGYVFSSIPTNQSERSFVYMGAPPYIAHALSLAMILIVITSLLGNSLVMYATRPLKTPNNRAFTRNTTRTFVRSLASSDILGALTTTVGIIEIYVPMTPNSWACHCVRYIMYFPAIITMMNIIVIGIERYFAIFRPFSLPSKKVVKRLVVAAWTAGAFMSIIPNISMRRKSFDIEDDKYTLLCTFDNSTPLGRISNLVFVVSVYYIPCIILSAICIKILRFLKRRKHTSPSGEMPSGMATVRRYKGSYMLVSLIFAFITPYFFYMVFNTLMMILKPKMSYITNFTIGYVFGIATFANGAVNPIIYLTCMQEVRERVKLLFMRRERMVERNQKFLLATRMAGNSNSNIERASSTNQNTGPTLPYHTIVDESSPSSLQNNPGSSGQDTHAKLSNQDPFTQLDVIQLAVKEPVFTQPAVTQLAGP